MRSGHARHGVVRVRSVRLTGALMTYDTTACGLSPVVLVVDVVGGDWLARPRRSQRCRC
jgi:hypothetical protein